MIVQLEAPKRRKTAEPTRSAQRVALVVMPVYLPDNPSLAVSTLAAELRRRGHYVDVHYLNLEAAVDVGLHTFRAIGSRDAWEVNAGEWLLSHSSITPGAADTRRFREFLSTRASAAKVLSPLDLERVRRTLDRSMSRWAEEIPWASYDTVGFSISFQQVNASIRLAHAIKHRAPHVKVVLGGSSMEHPTGDAVLERYPWLDAVFTGYADRSFPDWVESPSSRSPKLIADGGPSNLDELPVPEYDDYLGTLRRLGLDRCLVPEIVIETSRGCWYGQKQHCTFCGLNGLQMRFNQKSPDRALEELTQLARYQLPIVAADNILPRNYFDAVFPRLEQRGLGLHIFYEMKSNCTRRELESLARAGVLRTQPGIESLSTEVLRLMKKGVTGIQNLWLLRASEELGMYTQWGFLWGFPGEPSAEYARMAELVPKLVHLRPPMGCDEIGLHRHSPNFDRPSEHGFADVRPHSSYALAFGDYERLGEQAYSFEYGYADGRNPATYTRALRLEVERWIRAWGTRPLPRCEIFFFGRHRVLFDTRQRSLLPKLHVVDEDTWALFEKLESPVPRSRLFEEWDRSADLAPLLSRVVNRGWAYEGDGRVVRLAVVRPAPFPLTEARRVLRGSLEHLLLILRRRREPPSRS